MCVARKRRASWLRLKILHPACCPHRRVSPSIPYSPPATFRGSPRRRCKAELYQLMVRCILYWSVLESSKYLALSMSTFSCSILLKGHKLCRKAESLFPGARRAVRLIDIELRRALCMDVAPQSVAWGLRHHDCRSLAGQYRVRRLSISRTCLS